MTVPFSNRVVLSRLRNHSKVLCKLYCWFSQKHDVLLKEIEQLKEQYVIKFQEVTARIGVLKRIVNTARWTVNKMLQLLLLFAKQQIQQHGCLLF